VDLNGKRTTLFLTSSIEGLAWSSDGKEIWFAGTTNSGWADTLYAIKPGGTPRVVLTSPMIRLHDISKDGLVLLSRETWRRQMKGFFPGDKAEHFYSWLDDPEPTGITTDGRLVSEYEGGDVYALEHDFLAYYRPTDGSPAIRLGAGTPAISPDGKWCVLGSNHDVPHKPLQLQPLGPGQPKDLSTPGLVAFDRLSWSGDGRQIAYEAQTSQGDWNVYRQAVESGPPVLVAAHARNSYPVLSEDGKTVALRNEGGGITLYPSGRQPVSLKGVTNSEYPIRFPSEGKSLLVVEPTGEELVLTLVDLASGRRTPWRRFASQTNQDQFFIVTPDLKYYAYPYPRYSSVLYTVENLH